MDIKTCKKILIFAGTFEGHALAAEFAARGWTKHADFCVATEYGTETYDDVQGLSLIEGRLGEEEMTALLKSGAYGLIIDATHPYAKVVTENIKAAGASCNIPYIRLLRTETFFDREQVRAVDSIEEAVEILKEFPDDRVLLTTGSKELHKFSALAERAVARVLPSHESLDLCAAAGFAPKNICAMQGPFSKEMNLAQMSQYGCQWLVTKNTGKPGGFDDKVSCAEAGYGVIVIGRPTKETGLSYEEVLQEVEAIMENRYFPVFIPTAGEKAVVIGGGNIALRRVKTLASFDFDILVVSTEVNAELKKLADCGRIQHIEDEYHEKYLDGAKLITACTNDRETNRRIGEDAKKRGILVSVCDRREECSFYFPAVAVNDELTMGLAGSGKSHDVTRRAAAKLREIIKGKAY